MSPVRPGSAPGAVIAWRVLIVLTALIASVALGLGAKLIASGDEKLQENREVICSIGSFLTSAPIVRVEGTTREEFIGQLVTTRRFLADLRGIDCTDVGVGRPATTEEILDQLRRLRDQIREARGVEPRRDRGGDDDAAGTTPRGPRQDDPAGPASADPGAAGSGDGDAGGDGVAEPPAAPGPSPEPPSPPAPPPEPEPPAPKPPSVGQGVGQVLEGVNGIIGGACTTVGAAVGTGACP